MKAWITYLSMLIIVIVLLLCLMRLHPYYQYAQYKDMSLSPSSTKNDTLRIAFIGDSWADYHHLYDSLLCSMIGGDDRLVSVKSKGNVGAKSRGIYERMSTSTRPILKWKPHYCIISAGINDAVAKLGEDNYVHHYQLILRQLIRLGIKPVVLEVPDVNYRAIASRESWTMRLHHTLSSFLTGSKMYNFDSYRTSLKDAIDDLVRGGKVVYVPADAWNPMGYLDNRRLYESDETHLNPLGYHLLDSCIASVILRDMKQK